MPHNIKPRTKGLSKADRASIRKTSSDLQPYVLRVMQDTLLLPDVIVDEIFQCQPVEGWSEAYEFKWSYLREEILSKLPRPGVSPKNRYDAAIAKMLESESHCKAINDNGFGTKVPNDYFEQVMLNASLLIAKVLGPIQAEMFECSSFGGGATTHRLRKNGDPYFKYNTFKPVGITPGARNIGLALVAATPLWCMAGAWDNFQLTPGNRVFTVPKSTEIDRAACKEPCVNSALQKAVGSHIRSSLRRYGVDLNDQSVNQKLAMEGSLNDNLATIDLKSASDSISQRLVMELLPSDWVELLDKLRSPRGFVPSFDNKTEVLVEWEKHSTMGNGYTFELESLIFYAVSKTVEDIEFHSQKLLPATARRDVNVYGDDIIVPCYASANLINVLDDLGFKTNIKKTFTRGPFRESCGKHYYHGYDVSPFYIRKPIDSINRVIWLLNALRRWATDGDIADPSVQPLWLRLRRRYIHENLLGGNSMESTTEVASVEWPRFSLGESFEKRRIDGIPAILRCFQFQSTPVLSNHVKWYDITSVDPESESLEYIVDATRPPQLTDRKSVV